MVESVYCAVRTDSLYKADYVSSLKGLMPFFLSILNNLRAGLKITQPNAPARAQFDSNCHKEQRLRMSDKAGLASKYEAYGMSLNAQTSTMC